MSRWKLRIEERAEGEAREAFLWYRARNPDGVEMREATEALHQAVLDLAARRLDKAGLASVLRGLASRT